MLNYHLKQKKSLNSVRFVTHKGKSMKINTTINRGPKVRTTVLASTTDHHLIQNASKTTRFRESKPIIEFKGEPPF